MNILVNKRQITPHKLSLKQFETGTTLVFTLDDYKYEERDLRNYKAYAVTSIKGIVNMTELQMSVNGTQIELTWKIEDPDLQQAGAINYQIVFKENANEDGTEGAAVFYTYQSIIQCSESIDGDNYVSANYPTILKQWLDRINALSGDYDIAIRYINVGETLLPDERLAGRLYYQIEDEETFAGHFEDHNGNVLADISPHVNNSDIHITAEERRTWNSKADASAIDDHIGDTTHITDAERVTWNNKQNAISGAASTITTNNLTASRALVSNSDGKVVASDVTATEMGYLDGVTSNIQTQLNAKASSSSLTSHTGDTTVHITAAERTAWNGKAAGTHSHAISDVTNLQTTLNAKAPLASPTLTGTPKAPTAAAGTNTTQIATTAFVTTAVGKKQATVTGGATTITSNNLTASRALISDANGKVAVSGVTSTELGYLDGVTSNVQTQLNGKAPSSHTNNTTLHITSAERTKWNAKVAYPNYSSFTEILNTNDSLYTATADGFLVIRCVDGGSKGYFYGSIGNLPINIQVTNWEDEVDLMYPVPKGTTILRSSASGSYAYWLNAL